MNEWRRWFDSRLDDAIEAASTQQHPETESKCIFFYDKSFRLHHLHFDMKNAKQERFIES